MRIVDRLNRAVDRRSFIGGSDARIVLGTDETALLRLWREKRGEAEPEDLSSNLIVQLGVATEELNRRWYEANTGQVITDIQKHIRHPGLRWMAATLDGLVEASGAVFESKFMLPGPSRNRRPPRSSCRSSSITCGLLRHDRRCFRSLPVAASGSRSRPMPTRSISISSSPPSGSSGAVSRVASLLPCLVSSLQSRASRRFESSDMSSSNAWAEFAAVFLRTRPAHLEHEGAKVELKGLVPADAQQAIGHGIRAKRSKSGAISFDLLDAEAEHAAGQ